MPFTVPIFTVIFTNPREVSNLKRYISNTDIDLKRNVYYSCVNNKFTNNDF